MNDATHFLQNCSSFILVIHGVSNCLLVYESPTKKLFCRLHVCKDTFAIFTIFFRKTFAFPPFVLMSIFSRKNVKSITVHCCNMHWCFFSSFCSTAFQYQSFEKRTGYGVNPTLGKLRAGSKECVACAFCYCFLLLHCYSFFTLCASSSVELLSKNSQKHEVHLTLIKTFFPSFVSTSFKNKKEN